MKSPSFFLPKKIITFLIDWGWWVIWGLFKDFLMINYGRQYEHTSYNYTRSYGKQIRVFIFMLFSVNLAITLNSLKKIEGNSKVHKMDPHATKPATLG